VPLRKCLIVFLLFYGNICNAELDNKFSTSEGFIIPLDNDWVEIPREVLDQLSNAMVEVSDAPKQYWNYGYQKNNNEGLWATYPYVFVQVHENGRVPESKLKNYKKIEGQFQEGLQKAESMNSAFMSEATMGETYYDENRHALFTLSKAQVAEVGPITMLIAVILTEKGYVQYMAYTNEAENDVYLPLFKESIENIEFTESLAYSPRALDSVPILSGIDWTQVGMSGLIAGLIAGAFGLIGRFRKKG
jgi:hypothetical protein